MAFYLRDILFQKFWLFFPQSQHFCVRDISKLLASLCDKNDLSEEAGECITKKNISKTDIFHGRTFVKFPLDLGASIGAGLLKGEGILYFAQSKAEDSTPKDFVGIKEKKVSRVKDW